MSDQAQGRVGYSGQEAALRFVSAEAEYAPLPSDLYWKIALSVPDIELACAQLRERGVDCSQPAQFRDVGYLAKATDPEGFTIELIDHWFQGERPEQEIDETLLGGGAHLSLVTLRTGDIGAVEPDILDMGMKPLSVQPVEPRGFTLYFYAFTDEASPHSDLQAVENRSWVYRRPYTVLEMQHVPSLTAETMPAKQAAGYQALTISGTDHPIDCPRLRISSTS